MKKIYLLLMTVTIMLLSISPIYGSTQKGTFAVGDRVQFTQQSDQGLYEWEIVNGKDCARIISGETSDKCVVEFTSEGVIDLKYRHTMIYGNGRKTVWFSYDHCYITIVDANKKSENAVIDMQNTKYTGFRHYAEFESNLSYEWNIVSGNDVISFWDGEKQLELASTTAYCPVRAKKSGTAVLQGVATLKRYSEVFPDFQYVFTVNIVVQGNTSDTTPSSTEAGSQSSSAISSNSSASQTSSSSSYDKTVKVKPCASSASASKIKKKASTVKKGKNRIIMNGKGGFVKYKAKKTGTHKLLFAFMSSPRIKITGFATIGQLQGNKRKIIKFNLRGGYNNRQFIWLCTERYWESNGTYYYSGDEYFPQQQVTMKMKKGQTYYIYLNFRKGDVLSLTISQ